MEVTKVSDRVNALENEPNDENEETKSVGAVNIEFTGKFLTYVTKTELGCIVD